MLCNLVAESAVIWRCVGYQDVKHAEILVRLQAGTTDVAVFVSEGVR